MFPLLITPLQPAQTVEHKIESPAPEKKEKPIKLAEYLINFWDYDKSEFIQRYIAKGKKFSRMHTEAMKGLAKNYWLTYFGEDGLTGNTGEGNGVCLHYEIHVGLDVVDPLPYLGETQ